MRLLLALCLVASCVSEQLPARRPMVVDNVPYGIDRWVVRAWHFAHGWCMAREWPTTDEFVQCDPHPYINPTTPTMFSMIRYDDQGWSTSYAVFTPVPCTMQGRCDKVVGHSYLNPDHEFVEPGVGLTLDPAERGRAIERPDTSMPDMQERLYSALRKELANRRVVHTWADARGFGDTWESPNTIVGLFVSSNGAWIVETHEIKPQLRAKNPAHAHAPGTLVSL
jgi:hypothetical protein